MKEVWKPVEGYEGYEVSSHGNVRSLDREVYWPLAETGRAQHYGKTIKPVYGSGCCLVRLNKRGKTYWKSLARVVADAFVPGKSETCNFVIHRDGNAYNNRADNLAWSNSRVATRAVEALKDGEVVMRFQSLAEAAQAVGRSPMAIGHCCRGKTKSSAGYQWRYAQEVEE